MGGRSRNIKFDYTHVGETAGGAATIVANKSRVSQTENNRVEYSHTNEDGVNAIELLYATGISFFTKPIDSTNPTREGDLFFSDKDRTFERMRITSTGQVGIGTKSVGKELEVVGNLVSRSSPDRGGTAIAVAAETDGLGSIWTNNSYNPAKSGSGWKRTINIRNGNVGIGGSDDAIAVTPEERLVVAGNILVTGDVRLTGADCAEDFDVEDCEMLESGTVMIIADSERLRASTEAYDTKVAGVLSGAGECKPGIVLGRSSSVSTRRALALTGKVYCKVDASYAPIQVGDLLTTSPTRGHAMKASDHCRSFGAILGKALRALPTDRGLVPVLITLH